MTTALPTIAEVDRQLLIWRDAYCQAIEDCDADAWIEAAAEIDRLLDIRGHASLMSR